MPQALLSRFSILTNIILLHRDMKIQLEDSKAGERLRQGIQIAIVGAPNVGKSTLLNSMIQRPAAIVSPIPGTTRDIIETRFDLSGYPVIISDTAGLREDSNDIVEKEGIKRAVSAAKNADVLVFVQGISWQNEKIHKNTMVIFTIYTIFPRIVSTETILF